MATCVLALTVNLHFLKIQLRLLNPRLLWGDFMQTQNFHKQRQRGGGEKSATQKYPQCSPPSSCYGRDKGRQTLGGNPVCKENMPRSLVSLLNKLSFCLAASEDSASKHDT
ncbi:hypothetical protein BaRGS_00013844 [Batillaria attramentaria]|uniref:Secreted protein n=1 Tax=Batillaria attramentaria TaxID=370345 RepID=A0ABD0L748_9CAEN